MKKISALLVGAPNCGKSTLFYTLTHKRVDIGNRAGVTVSESAGKISKDRFSRELDVTLFDLPGIYSLSPHSEDERLTLKRLRDTRFDVIINVLDSTSLAAHLPLTVSLRKAFPKTPIIVAANMTDELSRSGLSLDTKALSDEVCAPVVCISASKRLGLDKLCKEISNAICTEPKRLKNASISPIKLAKNCLKRTAQASSDTQDAWDITSRADRIITSRWFGVPLFFAIFSAVFYVSFGGIGAHMTDVFNACVISPSQSFIADIISRNSSLAWLSSLINNGILVGVCAVLSFLPTVILFSFGLALLEDSGYLSRVAFLFDAPLRRVGLDGKAIIPVLLGFGCTVSAVLSTRNLASRRERRLCSLFLPLISCSARSPIYLSFCATLAPDISWFLCLLLYLLGIVCFLLSISIYSALSSPSAPPLFIIELPKYRFPRPSVILLKVFGQSLHFFKRAATVIFLSSVFTWLASSFSLSFGYVENPTDSILLRVSSAISPLFSPLGFDDPRLVASLIGGMSAKESTLSSLCILFEMPSLSLSHLVICGALNKQSALSYLVFFSLYTPCFPSMTAIYEENGKISSLILSCLVCLAFAYLCAFLTYRIGLIFAI